MNVHPRPLLTRSMWSSLEGEWECAFDEDGSTNEWCRGDVPLPRRIVVPFSPQAPDSGVLEDPVSGSIWYRRVLAASEVAHDGDERVLLHFGAVDYLAEVYVNGVLVTTHEGGYTPFSADITECISGDGRDVVVVHALDAPFDTEVARGKQAWREHPHFIWYERTIGIWRTPWVEVVPGKRVEHVSWTSDIRWGVRGSVEVSRAAIGSRLAVELIGPDGPLGNCECVIESERVELSIPIVEFRNGQSRDELLWSPESPTLISIRLRVIDDGGQRDEAHSYVGIREVKVEGGKFLLNGRPYRTRAVLSQNYWPSSHFTAPSTDALRREVELAKQLGFNTVRLHQKTEDPRFLEAADRLGLLVWAEGPSAYTYSSRAASRLVSVWMDAVRMQQSHPSVVCWVPFNESWGVQDLASVPEQRDFVLSVTALTRALDPSRPVISNDGWEHVDSHIIGVHDYERDLAVLESRYGTPDAVVATVLGHGPQGRRVVITESLRESVQANDACIMLSEFGGISWSEDDRSWGYDLATGGEALREKLHDLFAVVNDLSVDGFCYTQLTDTAQETNGLLWPDRTPKLPVEVIRQCVRGT